MPGRISSTALPEPAPSGTREGSGWALLLFLAVLVSLLRLWRLGQWGLWVDEAFTLHDIEALFPWRMDRLLRGNVLGVASVGAVVRFFGGWPDEWALRILPALGGIAGVPLCFWAFAPFAGRRRAAAAALILAASTWHLYWSQNARFYTLAQDLSLVSAGLLLRAYWSGRTAVAVLGAGAGILASLAHLSGALVPGAVLVTPWLLKLVRGPEPPAVARPRNVLTALAVLVALVGSWWAWGLWLDYRAAKAPDPDTARAVGHFVLTTGYYVTPILGIGALVGTILSLRRPSAFDVFCVCVCLLVLGCATVAATQARVTAQYVFVLLPWIALLATRPLTGWGDEPAPADRPRAGLRAADLAWIVLLVAPQLTRQALYFTVRHGERPRWRAAYEYVWNERGPDDLVIGMCPPVGEYYLSPDEPELRVPTRIVRIDPWNPQPPYRWGRFGRRTWIVMSHEWLEDWRVEDARELRRFLAESCHLALRLPLEVESRDLGVWVYVSDGA